MKYYIGIDLGGTNVRTLLVDEEGKSYSEMKDIYRKRIKVLIMYALKSLDKSKVLIIQFVGELKM